MVPHPRTSKLGSERRPSMGSEESGESHYRLVTLGGSGVGKSAILKRFLFGNYVDRHRPTVEELYCREFDICKYCMYCFVFIYIERQF